MWMSQSKVLDVYKDKIGLCIATWGVEKPIVLMGQL